MKLQQFDRQVAPSQIQALVARENQSKDFTLQNQASGLKALGQGLSSMSNPLENIQVRRNQLEVQNNLMDRTKEFNDLMNLMERDQSIVDFDAAFEEESKKIYEQGKESLSSKGLQGDYDQAFNQARESYRTQVQAVSTRRTMADGVARSQRLSADLLSQVRTTRESVMDTVAEISQIIDNSPFFSPEEANSLMEEYTDKAIDAAISSRISSAFSSADGGYLEKGDAAMAELMNQDIDELSAAQQQKYISEIDSLISREHTVQGWREDEEDDAYYDVFNQMFMNAMQSGNFYFVKEFCYTVDTHDEALPIRWLKMIEEAEGDPDKAPSDLSQYEYDQIGTLARNMNRDQSFKEDQVFDLFMDLGTHPSLWDNGATYLRNIAKQYQNPVFQEASDTMESFFDDQIKGKGSWDGLKDEGLQELKSSRMNQLAEIFMSGQYDAKQIPQVVSNFMTETQKEAIALELEKKYGLQSMTDLHPENLNQVKDLDKIMQMAEEGRFLGVRSDYLEDLNTLEELYDTAASKLIDQGSIPGLQKVPGQYLADAKPRYLAEVGGAVVDVQMMADGSFQYWMDYGNGEGEWSALEYDYTNPKELRDMQPKIQYAESPDTVVEKERDYRMPPDTSESESLPWSDSSAPGMPLSEENAAAPAPAMHDALKDEISKELKAMAEEDRDFIKFGLKADWRNRYHITRSELNEIIRSIKEEE